MVLAEKDFTETHFLNVSEFFFDTIQGEGINAGHPAAFLRLMGCTLNCQWCDTTEVWRQGNSYTFPELFTMMEEYGLIDKLYKGQHLVLTGGSPLRQQIDLIEFFIDFSKRYKFLPYVEIENECTLPPHPIFSNFIHCWNNSPKLSNSGNSGIARYKPHILSQLAALKNSWFKFVVDSEEDWKEIQKDFLFVGIIKKEQIILMPKGATREELSKNALIAVQMAVQYGVRYCTREHIVLWNKQTGV